MLRNNVKFTYEKKLEKEGKTPLNKKKHIFTFFLSVIFFTYWLFPAGESSATTLKDIPPQYETELNYLISKGIITGYPGGEFRPNQPVTRAQAATMVGRALELDGTNRQTPFTDVALGYFASGYITSAYEKGIILGDGKGNFRPEGQLTRLEMAYIIVRAFNLNEVSSVNYVDMPANAEQSAAINKVTTAGITNGAPGNLFKPNNSITRVEFSLMLARALNDDFKVNKEPKETDKSEQPKVPQQPEQSTPSTAVTKVVTASFLNVRSGPGTNYNVVTVLKNGTEVQVTGKTGNWYSINLNGKIAYVSASYIADKPVQKEPVQNEPPAQNKPPVQNGNERIIAVDAGHGDHDPGAVGNGLEEKDITLDVAKRLERYLTNGGYKVIMTRSDDTFVELDDRVKFAEDNGADIFISIHVNSFDKTSANGTETYYYNGGSKTTESKQLATFMQTRLVEALETRDRGVKTAGYRVIKANPRPATLVELAFISNSSDAEKLGSETYRDKAAYALYLGVQDYYKWLDK